MKKFLLLLMTFMIGFSLHAGAKTKVIKISVQPQEAAIYVDNNLVGYGYGEFTRPPKKNQVAIIRIECNELPRIQNSMAEMSVIPSRLP